MLTIPNTGNCKLYWRNSERQGNIWGIFVEVTGKFLQPIKMTADAKI